MFNRKTSNLKSGFDAVIGEKSTFEGNIYSEGSLRIDGKIIGDINAVGDILLGSKSHVKGNIVASNIQLAGAIEGNVQLTGILKILSTGRIHGDIQVKSFVSDEGAVFQGKSIMIEVPQIETSEENLITKNVEG